MGVEKWIPKEHILISGEIGIAKPDAEIFEAELGRVGLQKEDVCYVGDSFENDIAWAKGAGWKAVWYNHRGHEATGDVMPDYIVRTEKELIVLLENGNL